jgi:predicted Zn-dependent protease
VGVGRPQFIYRFRVVDELDVNAFAIFAGHVYVNRGLILMAQREGQLASVMAHEIGHIQARHPAKRLAAMQNVNLLGGLASLLLGSMTGRGTGRLLQSGLKLFGTAGILHYSREQEEEADALGVHYLYQAGFDPRDTVRMFRLLEEIQGQRQSPIGEFFSSHPSPRTRMEKVEGIIATLPKQPAFAERPEKFSAIQERLSRGILRGGYEGRRYLDILK